jgi:phage gp46-like protein
MPDIATVWDLTHGDWAQLGPALQAGPDLWTAVIISIFTDRLAAPDDRIPDGSADPRGWWGDILEDRPIGSKLWQYERSKATEQTRAGIEAALADALQWMIDDGVVGAIAITATWIQPDGLGVVILLTEPSGAQTKMQFQTAWQGLNN